MKVITGYQWKWLSSSSIAFETSSVIWQAMAFPQKSLKMPEICLCAGDGNLSSDSPSKDSHDSHHLSDISLISDVHKICTNSQVKSKSEILHQQKECVTLHWAISVCVLWFGTAGTHHAARAANGSLIGQSAADYPQSISRGRNEDLTSADTVEPHRLRGELQMSL